MIDVARLDFPLLRTQEQFRNEAPPPDIKDGQETIRWADHIVLCYPLRLGTLPALLKGFLEQAFRDGFAMKMREDGRGWTRLLKGKSARIVVTMGMPALVYRIFFGSHGLKSLERGILSFAGIAPIRASLIGLVDTRSQESRARWLVRMQTLGREVR
jgi:putative NADPH-quinone reductase